MIIGFAAETQSIVANAQLKLATKHADMIVANEVGEEKGFGCNSTKAWLVSEQGIEDIPETTKDELANIIFDAAFERLN